MTSELVQPLVRGLAFLGFMMAVFFALWIGVCFWLRLIERRDRNLIERMVKRGLSLNYDPGAQMWNVQRTILRVRTDSAGPRLLIVPLGSHPEWYEAIKYALQIEEQATAEALKNDHSPGAMGSMGVMKAGGRDFSGTVQQQELAGAISDNLPRHRFERSRIGLECKFYGCGRLESADVHVVLPRHRFTGSEFRSCSWQVPHEFGWPMMTCGLPDRHEVHQPGEPAA